MPMAEAATSPKYPYHNFAMIRALFSGLIPPAP